MRMLHSNKPPAVMMAALMMLSILLSLQQLDLVAAARANSVPPPPPPASSRLDKGDSICVVGGGSIGSSFCAYFLARGKQVVCCDPYVEQEALHQRIASLWPTVQARGLTRRSRPPFHLLTFETDLSTALANKKLIQECTYEDVQSKQNVLAELARLADPTAVIASSTSYIPHELLVTKIKQHNNKQRVLLGHPTIPHLDCCMELYGTSPEWVALAKDYYQQLGFDVVSMQKTIPGHLFNSFLTMNLRHGCDLVKKGVCSPEDVNTILRHLGRDLYARSAFLSILSTIGGERGVEGGVALTAAIKDSAISSVFFGIMKKLCMPDWVANRVGHLMARLLANAVEPPPPPAWIEASQRLEDLVTQQQTIPVQTGLFQACAPMYQRAPYEVDNDPFRMI